MEEALRPFPIFSVVETLLIRAGLRSLEIVCGRKEEGKEILLPSDIFRLSASFGITAAKIHEGAKATGKNRAEPLPRPFFLRCCFCGLSCVQLTFVLLGLALIT